MSADTAPERSQEITPAASFLARGTGGWWPRWRWLVALSVLYLALHVGYTLASPAFMGPDEPEHYEYVRSLAVHGELPRFDLMRNDFSARPEVVHTGLHGPVYYALLTPLYWALHPVGDRTALYGMRVATALMGVVLLWLVYAAVFRVFPDEVIARGTTIAAAVHPTVAYLGSTVSNEMLAALWAALSFYFLARIWTGDSSLRPWIGAGVAFGLGLVTKYTAAVVLGPILIVMWSEWRRRKEGAAPLLRMLGAFCGPAAILSGGWFLRNLMLYGHAAPLQYDLPVFPNGPVQAFVLYEDAFVAVMLVLWHLFWTLIGPLWLFWKWIGNFGDLWPALAALYLYPVAGWAKARFSKTSSSVTGSQRQCLLAVVVMLLLNIGGVIETVLFKQATMVLFAGRFLLTSMPWLLLLCVVGAARWSRNPDRRALPVGLFCAALFILNLAIIPAIWRFYRS